MKDSYKKHRDLIWYSLIVGVVIVGIFIDVFYGLLITLLIGVHFYFSMQYEIDTEFTQVDALGVGFAAIVMHIIVYGVMVCIIFACIDKKEIKVSNLYSIKYLENEKIVIVKDNNIEIINDAKLYWECRAKNCSDIIITNIEETPKNTILGKNFPTNSSTIYSVGSRD